MKEFGNVRKNCLWLVSSRETIKVAKRSKVSLNSRVRKRCVQKGRKMGTLRYGLPLFVTFIMWEEVAWGIVSGMVGRFDEIFVERRGYKGRKGGRNEGRKRKDEGEEKVEDMDQVDEEVDEWTSCLLSGLKRESSSARARLQCLNWEIAAHCHCFRSRCCLIWDRLLLFSRNASSPLPLTDGRDWDWQPSGERVALKFFEYWLIHPSVRRNFEVALSGITHCDTWTSWIRNRARRQPGYHFIKGVTPSHPSFSGHSALRISTVDMDVSQPHLTSTTVLHLLLSRTPTA